MGSSIINYVITGFKHRGTVAYRLQRLDILLLFYVLLKLRIVIDRVNSAKGRFLVALDNFHRLPASR